MASLVALAAVAAAAPFGGAPVPAVEVDSYRVDIRQRGRTERMVVDAPERSRTRSSDPHEGVGVGRDGTAYVGATPGFAGIVTRERFAARPDGRSTPLEPGLAYAEYVVAEARGGTLALRPVRIAGRRALLAAVPLTANDCAGLGAGTVRVWISARTLLPLRIDERRAGQPPLVRVYSYSRLNAAIPATTFGAPPLGTGPQVANDGFNRTAPAVAAGPLPYIPRLPTVRPPGFHLAVAGWAPRSSITGAEGSNPPDPWLFAAVYARGHERIEITQRASRGRDWLGNPFGGECAQARGEPALVGGARAEFLIGPQLGSSLSWRDGSLRHTVSGPFPKADLVAIAESLRKLGS